MVRLALEHMGHIEHLEVDACTLGVNIDHIHNLSHPRCLRCILQFAACAITLDLYLFLQTCHRFWAALGVIALLRKFLFLC